MTFLKGEIRRQNTVLGCQCQRHQRNQRYSEKTNVEPFLDSNPTKTRVVLITIPESEMPSILPNMQFRVSASTQVYAPIRSDQVTHLLRRQRTSQTLRCERSEVERQNGKRVISDLGAFELPS